MLAALAAAPTQAAPDATTAHARPTGELPRTGFQGVGLLIAYGWALLAGGSALRRLA